MTVADHVKTAKAQEGFGNNFEPYRIEGTPYALSIQAADWKYCTPRMNLPELAGYEDFEVAIFRDEAFFDVHAELPVVAELCGFEDGSVPVAGYVTLEQLVQIEQALLNV